MKPWGEPLPLITNGHRDYHVTYTSGARMFGHALDLVATSVVRPFAATALAAKGDVKAALRKPDANALKATGAALKGAGSGLCVGLTGAGVGLGEAALETIGGVGAITFRTCGLAAQGIAAGTRVLFGAEL